MNKARFLQCRRPDWQRFHELVVKAERARARLAGDEVSDYSQLFRALCHDLATVRSRDWGQDLERYLNDLVGRGNNCFYRSPPGRPRDVARFFSTGFPQLFRQHIRYFWVATVLFYFPAAIIGFLVHRDPSLASRVLPGTVLMTVEEMYSEESWETGRPGGMEAGMAGFYVHNNIGIAFRCFASGIFFGVGAAYFLVFNSIFLGTVSGYLIAHGHASRFLGFVVAHGAFELTAIVIAGAAGLMIGHAMVHPGQFRWTESLRQRGLVAVKLAVGAGGMLAIAALIEAFWSPLNMSPVLKFVAGAMFWVVVVGYLGFAGRRRSPQ